MTSQDSYAISKEIITNFFVQLTSDPAKASLFFCQNASLNWTVFKSTKQVETVPIFGKHSIHQFLKTVPELVYEVLSYDTQTVISENDQSPDITILVVTGNAYPVETKPTEPYTFHSSFHIYMEESDSRAAICHQTMNLFEMKI